MYDWEINLKKYIYSDCSPCALKVLVTFEEYNIDILITVWTLRMEGQRTLGSVVGRIIYYNLKSTFFLSK